MRPEPLHNEKELLMQVALGNTDAFTRLFEHYNDSVYKSAWWYLKSHALAQEIVQEVFIKVWSRKSELQQVITFYPWLTTLTKYYIIDYMRSMSSKALAQQTWAGDLPVQENSTDFKVRNSQYERLLEQALEQLPSQQKKIYKLARVDGLTYEEIGQRLSLSPFTVKTHMQRALTSIREFLRNHGEIYLLLLLMSRFWR